MDYTREHNLANQHPTKLSGERRAESAVRAAKKYDLAKAARKRAQAQKLLDEASDLEYQARRYDDLNTRYRELRTEIEEKAYWDARAEVGVLPRDENGDYITPAPLWRVMLNGEIVGEYRGEERWDVLTIVCPPSTTEHKWSDFELETIEEKD